MDKIIVFLISIFGLAASGFAQTPATPTPIPSATPVMVLRMLDDGSNKGKMVVHYNPGSPGAGLVVDFLEWGMRGETYGTNIPVAAYDNGLMYILLPVGEKIYLNPIGDTRPPLQYIYCYNHLLPEKCYRKAELEVKLNCVQAVTDLGGTYSGCRKMTESGWKIIEAKDIAEEGCRFQAEKSSCY